MLFDHTTSNANTTSAAAISADRVGERQRQRRQRDQGGQQGRDDQRPSRLDPQRDQAARDRADAPPGRDEAPGGRAAERARGDDRAEHEEGGQREVAAGVRDTA